LLLPSIGVAAPFFRSSMPCLLAGLPASLPAAGSYSFPRSSATLLPSFATSDLHIVEQQNKN
jgi:hypothetical protein